MNTQQTGSTRKKSFSFEIIFACLTVLVISVMAVTFYSYTNNSAKILDLSMDLIDQINNRVIQNTKNYLTTAVDLTELSSQVTGEDVDRLKDNQRLADLMLAVLRLNNQLKMFNIGNEKGDFLQLRKITDSDEEKKLDKNIDTITKVIDRSSGKAITTLYYKDITGKEVYPRKIDPNEIYDPRQRPWYKGVVEAKEIQWSEVYIFKTGSVPGITASAPVFSKALPNTDKKEIKGVFGLDIPLIAISDFLKTLKEELVRQKFSPSTIVFIVDELGELVAFPDPKNQMIQNGGNLRPKKVNELDIEYIKFSYDLYTQDKSKKVFTEKKFNFESNGKKYIASYKPFPKDFRKNWTIGLIVEEDDIIGSIKKVNRIMIIVSIIILGGAMVLGVVMLKLKKILDIRNKFIRDTFGRYLSDDVVENILESPEGAKLGGKKQVVTIMMTDLRGFTSLSERLPAETIVQIINMYLDIMTEVILKYQGTIDEFIGDAILVIFGAPTVREDDAKRAVACAIDMQLAMEEVNRRNREAGYPEVEMGIGINTGEIVVGNIGSSKRTKYGVVGSNVNLTSRVESYTVGGQILISADTLNACGGLAQIYSQMEVMPKGVKHPITISEVVGMSAPYNVFLPEKKKVEFKILSNPIPIGFTVISGKHISDHVYKGKITKLTGKNAEVEAEIDIEKLHNIKISIFDDLNLEIAKDLYGKVTENITSTPPVFCINLTSVPQEYKELIEKLGKG